MVNMPEKGENGSVFFRLNSWLPTGISSITGALLAAVILIGILDSGMKDSNIKVWNKHPDNLSIQLGTDQHLTHSGTPQTSIALNLSHNANPQTSPPLNSDLTDFNQPLVETPSEQEQQQQEQEIVSWISIPPESNKTESLLASLAQDSVVRNESCYDSHTATIRVPGLEGGETLELSAGKIHRFTIFAYDEASKARCSGGDYFETDLSSKNWKSRPPVKDLGNGSYAMAFQIHPDFAGDYVLRIILLFRSYLGLKQIPDRWVIREELLNVTIKFRRDRYRLEPLALCQKGDFQRDLWSGRWTHHGPTNSCEIDYAGRFRCLKGKLPCEKPWCDGNLALIESTGWVYSAHCSFRFFTGASAWDCLQNRWLFFWGDSNHVDSTRNLLNFVLGRWDIKAVPRRFDLSFTNPANSSQSVRITSVFNGHWNATDNYGGLDSLRNEGFRELLRSYFTGKTLPDVMIMNSGLHDGYHWRNMGKFSEAAAFASAFWREVLSFPGNRKLPEFIFRSTVAAAGQARAKAINPQKMEVFNALLLEQFRRKGLVSGVVDDFDLTYPWHYDHNCSDGAHYGRPPIKAKWHGQIGHQYFVDLMLIHVLLNRICPIG